LAGSEAKALAVGIAEVQRHYPMPIDPGFIAIGALATVAVKIYGGKMKLISARKRREKAEAQTGHIVPGNAAEPGMAQAEPWLDFGSPAVN
jgi:hypothetical protein